MGAPDADHHRRRAGESESLLAGYHREAASNGSDYGSTPFAVSGTSSDVPTLPAPKLRKAIRKLRAIRSVSKDYDFASSSRGAEPGVDVSRTNLAHLKAPLDVSITQWSEHEVEKDEFKAGDADALMAWLDDFDPKAKDGRTTWVNVNGLTGVALHRLATKFALHPLALEDAIHISRLSRSSATWYPSTLFVRLMSYEIDHEAVSAEAVQHEGRLSAFRRACRRLLRQSDDLAILQDAQARQGTDEFTWSKEATKSAATDAASLSEKEDDPTAVAHEVLRRLRAQSSLGLRKQQLSLFLTENGTIISIFSRSGDGLLAPINDRLSTPGTLLRSSQDPSMLLHGLLDVVVDEMLAIAEDFRFRLDVLEGQALLKADPKLVHHLHVLSSQFLHLKRAATPIHTLVRALKNDDERRSQHVLRPTASTADLFGSSRQGNIINGVPGHLSPSARIYLSDTEDHIESLVESLDLFSARASGLVDLVFNELAFLANRSMEVLTYSTVACAPFTLLTGFWGMNFVQFPSCGIFPDGVKPFGPNPGGESDFFWQISSGIVIVLVSLFLFLKYGIGLGVAGLRLASRRHERAHLSRAPGAV